jgi:lambda family phage portal protein
MNIKINLDMVPDFANKQLHTSRSIEALSGAYYGGSKKRRQTHGWSPIGGDADADTLWDLESLRNRSRDLLRNQPIATGAVSTTCTNVVGSGLKMQSRIDRKILGMEEKEAEEWQRNTEREWKSWANNLDCALDRGANFYDCTNLVFRSALESGDVFVLMPFKEHPLRNYGLKLQIIEADRICNKDRVRDTDKLTAGVEKDSNGAPTKYHIRTKHPGTDKGPYVNKWDTRDAFTKAGRRNIIHIYEKLRPGQTRGVPYLAPVLEIFKQLGKYTNAEIMNAVISAYFTVFVKSPGGDTGIAPFEPQTETGGKASDKDYKMGMGAFVQLANNEEVVFADPKRPNQNFDPFILAILRQAGVALGLPFEILIQHFQKSYSAARSAFLLAGKMFSTRRVWLVNHYCNIVYEAWMEEAVFRGRVAAPGFFDDHIIRQAYLGNTWIGPAPGQIDPTKETKAAGERIELRLTTRSGEAAAIGEDFDQNIEQAAKEERLIKESGLSSGQVTAGNKQGTENDNTDEDKEEDKDA